MSPRTPLPKPGQTEFQRALGEVVRSLRKPTFNQDDFADQVGVYRSHMGLIEQGKLDLRLSTLRALAEALELPLSELFRQVEQRQAREG